MDKKEVQFYKHFKKARKLIEEAFYKEGDREKISKTKLLKAVHELDAMLEILQQLINERENAQLENELQDMFNASASGTVEIIGNEWLHLRLEMLLPGERNLGGIKKLSNTVTNLLDCHAGYLGYLPQYEQAFVAIIEHSTPDSKTIYDHDNKGYRAIPNALKGRVFEDDNQFTMSLGLFTVYDENDPHCDIYVIPIEDIADFTTHYLTF